MLSLARWLMQAELMNEAAVPMTVACRASAACPVLQPLHWPLVALAVAHM